MIDQDTLERFETTAPRLLQLIAAFGDSSGRGDIIRQGWAFMPDSASPLDVAQAYRGCPASTRRLVRSMDSPTRVEFGAWLYGRHARHQCHIPLSVLRETLRALSVGERLLGRQFDWAIAPLLEGSPVAARLVTAAVGAETLWPVCRRLHADGLAPHAFRALFSAVWVLDHPRIRADITRETLASMMAFGRFEQPPGDVVTVWRGGHGVAAEALAAGWSWSTSYRWAAWFALATPPGEQGGKPVVITADVPAGGCGLIPDRMAELAGEILLLEPPAAFQTVGNLSEWEAEAGWAEASRLTSRPLGALGDATEALRWMFAPAKEGHPPSTLGTTQPRGASPAGGVQPRQRLGQTRRLTAANLTPRQRLLWLELTRRTVGPEEAERIAPNGEAVPVLEVANSWGLDDPATAETARRRMLKARDRFTAARVERLLPAERMTRFPLAHRGDTRDLRRLMDRVPVEDYASLCILVHERIAWHGCWQTSPLALRGSLRIAYAATPVLLAREAGGWEALGKVFAFAGVVPPWERKRQSRGLPAKEGTP